MLPHWRRGRAGLLMSASSISTYWCKFQLRSDPSWLCPIAAPPAGRLAGAAPPANAVAPNCCIAVGCVSIGCVADGSMVAGIADSGPRCTADDRSRDAATLLLLPPSLAQCAVHAGGNMLLANWSPDPTSASIDGCNTAAGVEPEEPATAMAPDGTPLCRTLQALAGSVLLAIACPH